MFEIETGRLSCYLVFSFVPWNGAILNTFFTFFACPAGSSGDTKMGKTERGRTLKSGKPARCKTRQPLLASVFFVSFCIQEKPTSDMERVVQNYVRNFRI